MKAGAPARLEGVSYPRLRRTAFVERHAEIVTYHPRSTLICLGCNEIGVPRLAVTTAGPAAAVAGH